MNKLKELGWNPKTILDIGAYKGNWTRETQSYFPNAKFTLIEPNDHKELLSFGPNVFYKLLGKENRTVEWFSNQTTGDSIYKENTRHYANITPIMKPMTTLDDLFPNQTFDYIKIDCQGAEIDILKGGTNVLKSTEVLLLECTFSGHYNLGAPSFLEYIQYTDSIGFSPFDITELHRADGILIQVDILFVRKTSSLWEQI